ncbi:unnamed protein product [Schistosoma margrebowiei]|uniref:G protein-coupled receptor kinase n=1 Tax=Schistosoma margrebowiei TaxID=48269 RepID=A0A3P8GNJ8_9TREM|nr:unnamed protein product [Schistosoma margrebowiei]
MQKYPPPLIPPRGEVNAADAFDIGSFDEEDTKGIKLTEADQALYQNFSLVVSERWQLEIAETVFDFVNQEADKVDNKKARARQRSTQTADVSSSGLSGVTSSAGNLINIGNVGVSNSGSGGNLSDNMTVDGVASDCIVEGDVLKLGGPFLQTWQRKHLRLFPNRIEIYNKSRDGLILKKGVDLISMLDIKEISPEFSRVCKMDNCISIKLKNDTRLYITSNDKIMITQWKEEILEGYRISCELMAHMNKKAHKMYGVLDPMSNTDTHLPSTTSLTVTTSGSVQPLTSTSRPSQKSHSPPQSSTHPRPRLSHQASMPSYPLTNHRGQGSSLDSVTGPKSGDQAVETDLNQDINPPDGGVGSDFSNNKSS